MLKQLTAQMSPSSAKGKPPPFSVSTSLQGFELDDFSMLDAHVGSQGVFCRTGDIYGSTFVEIIGTVNPDRSQLACQHALSIEFAIRNTDALQADP